MKNINKDEVLRRLLDCGVVAVVRMSDRQKVKSVIEAIRRGGIMCIEITMTVPGAVEIISELALTIDRDVLLGAGTVTDEATARAVIEAGAQFVVSPIFNPQVTALCKDLNIVCIPGCYSPTEIFAAWNAGADIIKVFPARNLGPQYFKDIAGPFPHVKLMPTGGVTIENVGDWVAAGAAVVGIGGELLDKKAIAEGRFEILTEKAKTLVRNYHRAKGAA